ncbi:MAG: GGDEF domain-containing protein [archaeon]
MRKNDLVDIVKEHGNLADAVEYIGLNFAAEERGKMLARALPMYVNDKSSMELLMGEIVYAFAEIGDEKNELVKLADEDVLTGLGNRRYFNKILKKEASSACRNGRDLSLVFFDIDHFKPFNDNYGHDAGDFVLSKLGRIVSKNVRASDIVSRYGGEEFAVILPDTDKKGGYAAAEKIRKAVESERWEYAGEDLGKVSVSLGVSGYNYADIESFIKRADEAAYVAKESGRNRTVVSED